MSNVKTKQPQEAPQRLGAPLPTYTRVAITLHWLIALLMIVNIAIALSVDQLAEADVRLAIDTHKSIGITVLGLVVLRILWRASHSPPPLPASRLLWERITAKTAHLLLYALMVILPLSGWMHDSAWKDADSHPFRLFGSVPWPRIAAISRLDALTKETLHGAFGQCHKWSAYTLYMLLSLHIAAALKHELRHRGQHVSRGMLGSAPVPVMRANSSVPAPK